jgi:WD40 repeat protein/predicted Ser/Thr protein kinase
MDTERHLRAKEIFLGACDLDPAARAAFLARACGPDAGLRAAVDELLANDESPPAALDAADLGGAAGWLAAGIAAEEASAAAVPRRIGSYRIVRVLGRGGMGTVYEAEQENPRRRVALKVLSPGSGSPDALQRFRREAQLLGRLHHPGIAHVYEAGTAEVLGAMQPYFVMELIEGPTLVEHARSADLGLEAKVELLLQVCDAVQDAHENGILHRDLKPSNIAVDAAGRAKVLDFGVARLLEGADDPERPSTMTGLVVGTLGTMSPEQVTGSAQGLDARTDVYSLGAVAYELLTGRPPLDVARLPLPEAARRICEVDPPLAGAFDARLAGDAETILAKALGKDRAQRYASARDLADDLRRYLRKEPIVARPRSTFYHLRMFARRNRALVAGVLIAAVALLVATIATSSLAVREARLRAAADASRARAEREAYRGNVVAAGLALQQYNRNHASALLDAVEGMGGGWELRRLQRGIEPWIAAAEIDAGRTWQAGFTGDGTRSLFVGNGGAVVQADLRTGERWGESAPDPERGLPVALSADACTVLSAAGDEIRAWDPRTGVERWRSRLPEKASNDPRSTSALAPDGLRAAVRLRGGGLLFVDAESGAQVELLSDADARVAFSPDGRYLATAASAETVLWDGRDGRRLEAFSHAVAARAVAVDPAGTRLAVSGDRSVHLIELAGGRVSAAPGPPDDATALAFSPDGRCLAGMLDDGTVLIWDEAGNLLERWPVGRSSWKTSLDWSADGEFLLTAAHTNDVARLWSIRAGRGSEVLRGHTSYVYPVAITPDGSRIVSGSWDGTVRVWSSATGACLAVLRSGATRVHALAISPDGAELVAAAGDGDLIAWDLVVGAVLARRERAGTSWAACLAWSVDGRTLAAACDLDRGRILLLEPRSLAPRGALEGSEAPISALAIDPSGTALAAANEKGELLLWDLDTGAVEARRAGLVGPRSIAFAPTGDALAVAGSGPFVLLDRRTLEERARYAGHAREVFSVTFAPDGGRLFSGGRDGLLRIWDPDTANLLGELSGHRDYIWCVAVSPDGARLATGSGDGDVRVWESEPVAVTDRRRRDGLALAERARPLVAALLGELGSCSDVADRITGDRSLGEAERRAALDELLRAAVAR